MGSAHEAEKSSTEEARWTAMGQHLRELRGTRRQEDLAEDSGVSVATIRAIENHPPGRRHTPRILKKLSQALGLPDDHLVNYLENPPPQEPGGGAGTTKNPPPRSALDQVVPRIDEILVARLNELVVPLLAKVEGQVRALVDIMHNSDPEIELDVRRADDAE
jgi:transcriptional regulator with XRE-family HTH domain